MTPVDRDIDPWLIGQYITGRASPSERLQLESRMATDHVLAREIEQLRQAVVRLDASPSDKERQGDWARIQARRSIPQPRVPLSLRRPWLPRAIAAIAGVTVMLALWSVAHLGLFPHRPSTPLFRTYTTTRGQRANLLLADGTHVVLGAMSTLRVPSIPVPNTRDVYLDGEGYFEVLHNPTAPFVVHAAGSATHVLGTSFTVRAYHGDPSVQVVVASGRVVFGQTLLNAGDVGVRSGTTVQVTHDVKTAELTAWITGKLVFNGTPLSEVATELSRWYDVQFQIATPALASRQVTATFTDGSADAIADAIAASLGVRYTRAGQTIVFQP